MVAAGLLAKNAVERGLARKPWVKSSLAPGSKVVTEYYDKAGLTPFLEALGFHTVGYGCTTCIGNSGPLPPEISAAVDEGELVVCAVLSGNRNFEARIHPEVKANYLASPPLVVAYALAGRIDLDLTTEPLGRDQDGHEVFLRDLWPTPEQIKDTIAEAINEDMYRRTYADVFTGDEHWAALPVPEGDLFAWDPDSTYVRLPPYFEGMSPEPGTVEDVAGARCLVMVGDSVTTDHISPAGAIKPDSPAGRYLLEHGVERKDFNSYGSRRGNHEVMVRGTFANVRLRNLLVPGSEGTWTVHLPDGEESTIFEAAERYRADGVPTIVLAGKEYGSGSSRDWAAKGPNLLGVRAVIAESYERIHRSNLIGMGIVPLQYPDGENAESLGLTGRETFAVEGLENGEAREAQVTATPDGDGDAGRLHRPRAPGDPARARLSPPRRHPALRAAQARGRRLGTGRRAQPGPAEARLDKRLEASRSDRRADLRQRSADEAQVHRADDVAVLLREVAKGAAVHEHVAVLALGLEAVLVQQLDDPVRSVSGRLSGRTDAAARPGSAPRPSPARSAAAAPSAVPESEPARIAASSR